MKSRRRRLQTELEELERTDPAVADARRRLDELPDELTRYDRHMAARTAVAVRSLTVYVATIDLKYDVIAVAATEAEAIHLVSRKAYDYLKTTGALYPETDTPQKIAAYFGVTVTRITVGTAEYVGNE